MAKYAHRELLDMSWPLSSQLEKLDIVPLHPVYGDSQHGVLVLGCTNEAADPLNDLTARFSFLLFGLLTEEHDQH